MRKTFVYLSIAMMSLAGCGKESREDIAENLKDKDAMDVVRQAADDEYDPPADGKLTETQIEMYLKVREKEVEIAKVARQNLEAQAAKVKEKGDRTLGGLMEAYKGMGSAADFLTADIRAAQELGFNTAEYMWVKGQVVQASAAEYAEKAQAQMSGLADQAYTNLKKQYDETTDETTRQTLKTMLDQMEKNRAELDAEKMGVDDADRYNRDLLSKFEEPLKAIAMEATKWNDDEKDADQLTDELKKGLEATTSTQEQ